MKSILLQLKKMSVKKKTKSIISLVLALVLVLTAMPLTGISVLAASSDITGSGTEDDPYLIYTAAGLFELADKVNGGEADVNATLMADIDLNPGFQYDIDENGAVSNVRADGEVVSWTPIGKNTTYTYAGTFDGNGYTISGMYVDTLDSDAFGLFGYVATAGVVKNLGIVNSCINLITDDEVKMISIGGLVGYNYGTVIDCYNAGTVSFTTAASDYYVYIGGMAGRNGGYTALRGTLTNCYNEGTVSAFASGKSCDIYIGGVAGETTGVVTNNYNKGLVSLVATTTSGIDHIGGLLGRNSSRCINSYNIGDIKVSVLSSATYVGGVAGDNYQSTIKGCYNAGDVESSAESSSSRIGGLVGESYISATITESYNTGSLKSNNKTGTSHVAGLVGYVNIYSTVTNCYNTGAVSDGTYFGGAIGQSGSAIENCYYLNSCVSNDTGAYGTALTIEQMSGTTALDNMVFTDPSVWVTKADEILQTPISENDTEAFYATNHFLPQLAVFSENPYTVGYQSEVSGMKTEVNPNDGKTYYLIYTTNQLRTFAQMVNGGETSINAKLMADIDLNPGFQYDIDENGVVSNVRADSEVVSWTPTGLSRDGSYSGTFDGDGHTVSGMYIDSVHSGYIGLFGYTNGGTVKNVGIVNSCINVISTDSIYVGGIVGVNFNNSTIDGCYSTGAVSATLSSEMSEDCIGGIAGRNVESKVNDSNQSTIINCYNTGDIFVLVTGSSYYDVGGVVGDNSASTIKNCYNTGDVKVSAESSMPCVGGMTGLNRNNGTIENCYNTGDVSSTGYYGGITGRNNYDGTVQNCYYLDGCVVETTNIDNSGTALTIEQMSGENAFTNMSGFDFNTVWCAVLGKTPEFVANRETDTDSFIVADDDSVVMLIYSADGIRTFAKMVNGGEVSLCAILMADIDLNPGLSYDVAEDGTISNVRADSQVGTWTPIGPSGYVGIFDGNGHTVSGMYINSAHTFYAGLFGLVNDGGTVKNLGIINSCINVTANYNISVGSVAGVAYSNGIIENCYSTGAVSATVSGEMTKAYIGGVVGLNQIGTIKNCYNTGTVSAFITNGSNNSSCDVGGVAGYNTQSTIENSYNTGAVYGFSSNEALRIYTGGVIGENSNSSTIKNCYNTGDVTGAYYTGGVAGIIYSSDVMENCYNTGAVMGTICGGGVVGRNSQGTVQSCYYLDGCVAETMDKDTTNGTALTIDKMTGENALNNMQFTDSTAWVTKADEEFITVETETERTITTNYYLPQLTVFSEQGNPVGYQSEVSDMKTEINPNDGNTYYLIYTADQLRTFAYMVNNGGKFYANAKLMADIDLNPGLTYDVAEDGTISNVRADSEVKKWAPIGAHNYYGVFDGDGHTVSGMYIDTDYGVMGLFGIVYGTVKNLGAINSCINIVTYGEDFIKYVGSLAAENLGTIENCYSEVDVYISTGGFGGGVYAGGIAGINNAKITNCYNTGAVTACGTDDSFCIAGGIVGGNSDANGRSPSIVNCYNTGEISAIGSYGNSYAHAAGIVVYACGTITNCYNIGVVKANSYFGRHVGSLVVVNEAIITNCYYLDGSASDATITSGTALSIEQMTGSAALDNMVFTDPTAWVTKANVVIPPYDTEEGRFSSIIRYLPQLAAISQLGVANLIGEEKTFTTMKTEVGADGRTYYLIYNADQLRSFANIVNNTLTQQETDAGYTASTSANAKLMANIDLNPGFAYDIDENGTISNVRADSAVQAWMPMGGDSNSYEGVFEGNGHTISGMYVNALNGRSAGLFGYINGGTVQNVGIVNSCINVSTSSSIYVGGVTGYIYNGTIQNCYNTGAISVTTNGESKDVYAGGVVGENSGTITNCYNTGAISATASDESGYAYVGGMAGWNSSGTITSCYNTGAVSASSIGGRVYAGGVAGDNGGTITNCYNTGDVSNTTSSGRVYVGGVAGFNDYGDSITNCYNIGDISATTSSGSVYVGGVVGYNYGDVNGCYYKNDCVAGNATTTLGTALTINKMTGSAALDNMIFSDPTEWVTKANKRVGNTVICYLPQLTVFSENTNVAIYQISAEEDEILLPNTENSSLVIDRVTTSQTYMVGIDAAANTVADIKAALQNNSTQIIITRGDTVLSDTDRVGTGCVVKCVSTTDPTVVYESATVILYGDINGDGLIDSTDHMSMYNQTLLMQDEITADSVFFMAADMNGDGYLDIIDYFIQERQITGTYLFDQAVILYTSDRAIIFDRAATQTYVVGLNSSANTVADLNTEIGSQNIKVIATRDGVALSDTDHVGTGCVITCVSAYDPTVVFETATVILYGDINGDGLIDDTDLSTMYNQAFLMQNVISADSLFYIAGDMNGDGYLDIMDYYIHERQVTGTTNFNQSVILYK